MSRSLLCLCASAHLAALSAFAHQQPRPETTRYEIRGTVIDHLTSHPIARALVRLSPVTGPGQLSSITSEDGRFGFANIPQGKYRLIAQKRGRLPHAFHETGQYSTAIVVGPGVDSSNIIFPLQSTASISGTVVDGDGEPLQAAAVIAFREMVIEGEKRVVQFGNYQTNSLGHFRAGPLPAGTYYFAAQAQPEISPVGVRSAETDIVYPLTYYGDTSDAQAAQPVTLSEGATAQLQINLRPVPNIHVPLPASRPGAEQSFPSLLLHGPGTALIPVNAMQVSGLQAQAQNVTGPIRSQPQMELTGFPAGHYFARINTTGPSPQSAIQEVDLSDGVPWAGPEHSKPIAISGQFIFEDGQRPATNLQVIFGRPEEQNVFFAESKPDGSFILSDTNSFGMLPGWYSIRLNSADYFIKSITAKGARMSADRIELLEGSSPTLTITLAPAAMLSQLDGFALRDDKPKPGAMVLLVPSDLTRGTLFRRDQSDSDGSFTLPSIAPGKYTLLAIDDDGRGLLYKDPNVIRPYLAAGQPITVPRSSKTPVRITVQPRLP